MKESSSLVPHILKSRSPDGLRALCIKNNAERGEFFKYFDFQSWIDVRGVKWFICFYYDDHNPPK